MALRTLIALAALARVAIAQEVATDGAQPPPRLPPTKTAKPPAPPLGPPWEFGLGFAGGAESIGDATFGQIGISVGVARRVVGDLAAGIRGELITTNRTLPDGEGTLIIGQTLRGLAGLEWTLYQNAKPFLPRVALQGGIGRELTAWDRGTIDRGLVYAGAIMRSSFDIPKRGPFHGIARMGTELSVRLSVAPALPGMAIARACTLCGATSAPSAGRDYGIMFHYGLAFGR